MDEIKVVVELSEKRIKKLEELLGYPIDRDEYDIALAIKTLIDVA